MSRCSLLLLLLSPAVLCCPYAGTGAKLPNGHPDINRRQLLEFGSEECANKYQCNVSDWDEGGSAMVTRGLAEANNPDMMTSLDAMAKRLGQPVCYWAFQALPRPTNVKSVAVDDPAWIDHSSDIHALAQEANARFQNLYPSTNGSSGSAFFSGLTTYGTEVNKALCHNGLLNGTAAKAERCSQTSLDSVVPTPYAMTIFKFTGDNLDTAKKEMKAWREDESGHLPMERLTFGTGAPYGPPSEDIDKIWGVGGLLTFKAVLCEDVPARFQEAVGESDRLSEGKPLADDVVDAWRKADNICFPNLDAILGTNPFVASCVTRDEGGPAFLAGLIGVIIGLLCCLCGCCFGCYKCYKKKQAAKGTSTETGKL